MKNLNNIVLLLLFNFACYSQTYFIKFLEPVNTDISIPTGDSFNAAFPGSNGWSEMLALDFEVLNPLTIGIGPGGVPQGIPQTGMIRFTKVYSPIISSKLSTALVIGAHYGKVKIIGTKMNANSQPTIFVVYDFETAFVGNIKKGFADGPDESREEEYLLKAGKFTVTNYNYPNPDNTGTPTCKGAGWNFINNTEIVTIGCPAN